MSTRAYQQRIEDRAAWRGSDLTRASVEVPLQAAHVHALDAALEATRGLPLEALDSASFALPAMADAIATANAELHDGRGVVLFSGLPVQRYSLVNLERLYYGLGAHFGTALSQSVMGDRIGHVTDVSGKDPNERAYRNSLEIPPHTDSAGIVGMLSVRRAKAGGLSTYTSALAIHNRLLETRPELLEPLYAGYRVHCFGEQPDGAPPVTDYRVPVLSERDGVVSVCIVPEYIDMAEVALGTPLEPLEREAFDAFIDLAEDPDLRFDIMLEPGDISFVNNYAILHSRTAFDDDDAPDKRRLLLRLWLEAHESRPLDARFNGGQPNGIEPQSGRTRTYFGGDEARRANRGRYGASL